jgi:hypothetical protein
MGASFLYAPISTFTTFLPICSCSVSKGDVKKMAGFAHFLMMDYTRLLPCVRDARGSGKGSSKCSSAGLWSGFTPLTNEIVERIFLIVASIIAQFTMMERK